jgi:glucosamine kinase
MTDHVAAIDGGGTKTAAALADRRGNVTILPPRAGCNPQDGPGWDAVLTDVIGALRRHPLAALTLGMPGWGEVAAHDTAVAAHVAGLMDEVDILNDVALAFHGAFPDGHGLLVLSGTGTMAIAAAGGPLVRVGGWGDMIGDEGSAHWIGVVALRRAAQEMDGRQADTGWAMQLMPLIGQAMTPFAPLDFVQSGGGRAGIAGVARQVDALAARGDPVARDILLGAAREIAACAQAAERAAGGGALNWAPAGSVFRSATVLNGVAAALGRAPVTAAMDALGGGLVRAARKAGWRAGPDWTARVGAATRAWSAG